MQRQQLIRLYNVDMACSNEVHCCVPAPAGKLQRPPWRQRRAPAVLIARRIAFSDGKTLTHPHLLCLVHSCKLQQLVNVVILCLLPSLALLQLGVRVVTCTQTRVGSDIDLSGVPAVHTLQGAWGIQLKWWYCCSFSSCLHGLAMFDVGKQSGNACDIFRNYCSRSPLREEVDPAWRWLVWPAAAAVAAHRHGRARRKTPAKSG